MSKKMTPDEFVSEHETTASDQATQDYIRKLERTIRNLKSRVGSDEMLLEYLKDSLVSFKPPKMAVKLKSRSSRPEIFPVLVTTDQHAEEFVAQEEMEGLSSYDWDTFVHRMTLMSEKTLELVNLMRQAHTIKDLQVWALGDWFLGKIQPQEEAWGNSLPFPRAVAQVPVVFASVLRELSAHFRTIYVSCVCGNHGREGKPMVTKMTGDRNWDMSVYLLAQEMTKDIKNIVWNIPKSIMTVVEVAGWKVLLTHSGEVKMNNRVPYYPIENTIQQERQLRAGQGGFHYAMMGHYHHHAVMDGTIIINPSMIGNDQYSRYRLHRMSPPEQMLHFFHPKNGLINQWPLRLG